MKNFKIRNLVGVLVVSATVLLTGCKKIESVGKFGEAAAYLNTKFDAVYDDSFIVCNKIYEVQRLSSEISSDDFFTSQTRKMLLQEKENAERKMVETQKKFLECTESEVELNKCEEDRKNSILAKNELLKCMENLKNAENTIAREVSEIRAQDIYKRNIFQQAKECGDLKLKLEKLKKFPAALGKLGELLKVYSNLEFANYEEAKTGILKLPGEVIKVETSDGKNKLSFDPTKINTVIDRVFAFIPEAIMRARVQKKLVKFIQSNSKNVKESFNVLKGEVADFFERDLQDLRDSEDLFNKRLEAYYINADSRGINYFYKENLGKIYLENINFIENREKLLADYRIAVSKMAEAFDEMVLESENGDSFEGDMFNGIVTDLLGFLKNLNLEKK